MNKNTLRMVMYAVAGVGSLLFQRTTMAAPTYTWALTGGGAWGTTANWTKTLGATTYPSAPGDVANLNIDFTAASTITTSLAAPPIIGILNWGDSTQTTGAYQSVQIGSSTGSPPVTFNNNGASNGLGGFGALINHPLFGLSGNTGDSFRSDIILQDNLTVNVGTLNNNAKIWGGISESGGSFGITKIGPAQLQIQATLVSNTYSGLTTIAGGTLNVSNNPGWNAIPGNILITGSGSKLQMNSGDCIADTANITFADFGNENWNMGAPGGTTETIGSLTSNSGRGNIYSGGVLTLAAASGTTSYGGVINVGTVGDTPIALSKTGGSTQTLAGTGANVLTSVSVTGGILELNKTAGAHIDAIGNYNTTTQVDTAVPITLGDGAGHGTIRLLASNQISDVSTLTFNAGKLDMNGFSEALGTLTNSGASTIDMGAGASILTFANSSGQTWTGSIQILNWSGSTAGGGTDQLLFGAGGLSAGQVGLISFVNPSNYAPGTYGATMLPSGEVVAVVPEPAVLGTLGLSSLLVLRRRRLARA